MQLPTGIAGPLAGSPGYAPAPPLPVAAHRPIDPASRVPEGWRTYVIERVGRPAPSRMTDGRDGEYKPWSLGHDPGDPVDRAVMATRRAVFPLHGLDPWFD